MQESLFPHTTEHVGESFGPYHLIRSSTHRNVAACLFRMTDSNNKNWYIVANRHCQPDGVWLLKNALEFRHAYDRAEHEYRRRINDR